MKERKSVVVEEYLQAIYSFHNDGGIVKSIHLAKKLDTSPSTVHATLSRMQRDNLVTVNKKKEISLTEEGIKQAEDLVRRHSLVEYFLCHKLNIPWAEVHKHAHVLEHALTPLVADKLAEFLGFPERCPHGTLIPGQEGEKQQDMVTLENMGSDSAFKVIMIDESLEDSEDLMRFLQEKKLVPGEVHTVVEKLEITKTIQLESEAGAVTIPFDLAQKIFGKEVELQSAG